MTTCALVLGVISCVVDPGTRPTPAQAAAILAPYQYVAPPVRQAPLWLDSRSSVTAGPYGEFAPFSPARRLDGSLYSDPPWGFSVYAPRHDGHGDRHGAHLNGPRLRPAARGPVTGPTPIPPPSLRRR